MHNTQNDTFIRDYQIELRDILTRHPEIETTNYFEGLPRNLLHELLAPRPLSIFIPEKDGGRGGAPHHRLAFTEAVSYESIAVGLMMGINGSLFLEPVGKYGQEEAKSHVFKSFLNEPSLGGLMITEPDYGTDALSMQTSFVESENHFSLNGSKHWGGLTGLADFWLVTARKEKQSDKLARDIDLFIVEKAQPGQKITVDEYFHKLGLFLIPYGLNNIDVTVPASSKLIPQTSGLKLMMDLLHRSRLRLSGIGLGFIRRMLDESVKHCQLRSVGGKSLQSYDQVQHRISQLQSCFTIGSAMCHYSARVSGVENNLTSFGIQANATKSILTDMMQESAQSLLQLTGAKGYRRDHIAGRSVTDSRPFQIFEGSNDVMYSQVADAILNKMKKVQESNLYTFLSQYELTERIVENYKQTLNFTLDLESPQRNRVTLGKVAARLVTAEFMIDLQESGFRKDLIDNAIQMVGNCITAEISSFCRAQHTTMIDAYQEDSDWKLSYSSQV